MSTPPSSSSLSTSAKVVYDSDATNFTSVPSSAPVPEEKKQVDIIYDSSSFTDVPSSAPVPEEQKQVDIIYDSSDFSLERATSNDEKAVSRFLSALSSDNTTEATEFLVGLKGVTHIPQGTISIGPKGYTLNIVGEKPQQILPDTLYLYPESGHVASCCYRDQRGAIQTKTLKKTKVDPQLLPSTVIHLHLAITSKTPQSLSPEEQASFIKSLGFLANGAFGAVYRGLWDKRPVALKQMLVSKAQKVLGISKEEVLEAFDWEVSRLSTLSHPNLVQFYGVYADKDAYFVMEFCEGGTLQDRIEDKTRPITQKELWQITMDMLQGLAYLHEQGVLHRDLKAENILFDKIGRAKLADLGVAQVDALLQDTEASVVAKQLQDLRFIPPERLLNQAIGSASDIYAFGLVLWQLVSCQLPRKPQSREQVLSWMQSGQREPIPTHCPKPFHDLILSCWQIDPSKRPTAIEMISTLEKIALEFHPQAAFAKACTRLDLLIQEKRAEFFSYIPPFTINTDITTNLDDFWRDREKKGIPEEKTNIFESKEEEKTSSSSSGSGFGLQIQSIEKTLNDFLLNPSEPVLLLLGDGGLGKTLTTYKLVNHLLEKWCVHLSTTSQTSPPYLPVLIRPGLKKWSHANLTDAVRQALQSTAYNLGSDLSTLQQQPLLLIIDGYDELTHDKAPENLPKQLMMANWPGSKLIVTCRRNQVEERELTNRFGLGTKLFTRYLLPFRVDQMLNYLQKGLHWDQATYDTYKTRLDTANTLRATLRSPFVLSQFVKSFETISKKDFKQLNLYRILECVVEHWIKKNHDLLLPQVKAKLKGGHPTLLRSFDCFAQAIAFQAFIEKGISLNRERAVKALHEPALQRWLQVQDLTVTSSQTLFRARSRGKRSLLTERDYVNIMLNRLDQFFKQSPLKIQLTAYSFFHKSVFEYFVAQKVLATSQEPLPVRLALLGQRPLTEERQVLHMIGQACPDLDKSAKIKKPLLEVVYASKNNPTNTQAASNALTALNYANVQFNHLDLSHVHLRGVDLLKGWFYATSFRWAKIEEVQASQTTFYKCDFTKANLSGIEFGEYPAIETGDFVHTVAFHPIHAHLVAYGEGDDVVIFDRLAKKVYQRLEGHTGLVKSVAFSPPDGRLIASGSNDTTVRIWDTASGALRATLEGHTREVNSVAFSPPDGRLLASGSFDKTVRIWNTASGALRATLEGHTNYVRSVVFSPPDGRLLASGSEDETVRIWNTASGSLRATLQGHTHYVNSVAFSPPDGRLLASASKDKTVRIWNTASGSLRATLQGHTHYVNSVAFSPPDGRLLASGSEDKTVRIWDTARGALRATLEGHTWEVNSVAFSPPDGRLLASASLRTVRIWDTASGALRATLEGHTKWVTSVAFSPPDGRLVASGSWDSTVRIWDTASGALCATLKEHTNSVTSVAFSPPDGRLLASGSGDKTVRIWDTASGALRATLEGHTGPVYSVAFSLLDGRLLASGSGDKTVRIWDTASGALRATLEGHTHYVNSVAFSPPDGRLLASASEDKTVRIWDTARGALRATLQGHTHYVNSVAFSPPDGRLLASGSWETVPLWDTASGTLRATLEGHTGHVKSVAFSPPDGRLLASGSSDGTVRILDTASKKCLNVISWIDEIKSLTFSRQNHLVIGGENGVACFSISKKTAQVQLLWIKNNEYPLLFTDSIFKGTRGLKGEQIQLVKQRGAIKMKRNKRKKCVIS